MRDRDNVRKILNYPSGMGPGDGARNVPVQKQTSLQQTILPPPIPLKPAEEEQQPAAEEQEEQTE